MLDRTISPPSYRIKQHKFPVPEISFLSKDTVPMYVLDMGTQPIVEIELILDSGAWHERKKGVAYFTAQMLLQGTHKMSNKQIAEEIDFYGAEVSINAGSDKCTITLSCLSKFLEPMLELLVEILLHSSFAEERLQHVKNLKLRDIAFNRAKVSWIANKTLTQTLFSDTHPYGAIIDEECINLIAVQDLDHYYKNKLFCNCHILVSGRVSSYDLNLIENYLKRLPFLSVEDSIIHFYTQQPTLKQSLNEKSGLQAAICMGKVLFSKRHEDFIKLFVVNTLLGGFFGSRLMRNIRETNGYTYGIYSQLTSMQHSGCLIISAEVAAEYDIATCDEIEKEIKNLQNIPIEREELNTLKSYLKGMLLVDSDNPFVVMSRYKALYTYGLNESFFDLMYDTIFNIDSKEILEIAQKYLCADTMSRAVVR